MFFKCSIRSQLSTVAVFSSTSTRFIQHRKATALFANSMSTNNKRKIDSVDFTPSTAVNFSTTTMASKNVPTVKNFIHGIFEESITTKWIDVFNPATQELVCRVPQSTPEELSRAEASSAEALRTWREVPVQQRQRIFFTLQALIREHTDELAKCITVEQGKTLADAKGRFGVVLCDGTIALIIICSRLLYLVGSPTLSPTHLLRQ